MSADFVPYENSDESSTAASPPTSQQRSAETEGSESGKTTPGGQIWAARVLLVLFGVFSLLSVAGIWARDQVLETDAFVETMGPLARHPDVQVGVSNAVADYVVEALGESREADADQPLGGLLEAPINQAIGDIVGEITAAILGSETFQSVWDAVVRTGHEAFVLVMTGEESANIVSEEGQVAFDLSPIVAEIDQALSEQGIDLPEREPDEQLDLKIVVFESEELAKFQEIINILDDFAFYMPVLGLLALVGYFVASRDRWSAVIRSTLTFGGAMIVLLILVAAARSIYLRNLDPEVDENTAAAFFDVLTNTLRDSSRLLALGGLAVSGIVALARPREDEETGRAVSAREQISGAHDSAIERWPAARDAESSLARHRGAAIAIFLGIIGLIVLIWDRIPPGVTILLIILALTGSLVLWLIPGSDEPETPTGTRPESTPRSPLPPTSGIGGRDSAAQLQDLADLRSKGLVTPEEFEAEKRRLLSQQ